MLVTALTSLIAAIVLMFLGFRGRRLDDHPICRGCGYDLHGIDDRSESCPECGRSLLGRRAVRIGRRGRRPALLASGFVLLALAIGFGLPTISAAVDWNEAKPVWLLAWEMRKGAPTERQAAFDELNRRLAASTLSAVQHRRFANACLELVYDLDEPWNPYLVSVIETSDLRLADDPATAKTISDVLRIQSDGHRAWRADVGNRVEWLRTLNLVSDAEWATYFRQAMHGVYRISVPERIRPESPIWISYERAPPRLGDFFTDLSPGNRPEHRLDLRPGELSAGGAPLSPGGVHSAMHSSPLHQPAGKGSFTRPHSLTPGKHELTLPVEFAISLVTRRLDDRGVWVAHTTTEIASWAETYELSIEVVPEGVQLVATQRDPLRAEQIRNALSVRVIRGDERRHASPGDATRRLEFKIDEPPVNVAFEVSLRKGDKETSVGALIAERCENCASISNVAWPDADWLQNIDRVDAVFRSSVADAEARGLSPIWAGEIELSDVLTKRLPFRDAPPDEQIDRLRDVLDVSAPQSASPRGGGRGRLLTIILRDLPVALDHNVECRAGEHVASLGQATAAVGSSASLRGTIDLGAGADPPGSIDLVFTPVEAPAAGTWPETFTITEVVLPTRAQSAVGAGHREMEAGG